MSSLSLLILGIATALIIMTSSWLLAKKWNFYSLVDVAWAYGIGLIGLVYLIVGTGSIERRILLAGLTSFWSLRLGTHLVIRLKKKFPEEDPRYIKIKTNWGAQIQKNFFWFFQFQAVSQPLLCAPMLLAATSASPLNIFDILGVLLCFLGICGETLADNQLKFFKQDPDNKGQVCDQGLWRYSRHPNYFFEWIVWCGFGLFGLQHTNGYLSLISPAVMFVLLNFVTGVPPLEDLSIKSKGDLYRDYQKRTSRFFPWFTKSN